jgi:hypothetical protein
MASHMQYMHIANQSIIEETIVNLSLWTLADGRL